MHGIEDESCSKFRQVPLGLCAPGPVQKSEFLGMFAVAMTPDCWPMNPLCLRFTSDAGRNGQIHPENLDDQPANAANCHGPASSRSFIIVDFPPKTTIQPDSDFSLRPHAISPLRAGLIGRANSASLATSRLRGPTPGEGGACTTCFCGGSRSLVIATRGLWTSPVRQFRTTSSDAN